MKERGWYWLIPIIIWRVDPSWRVIPVVIWRVVPVIVWRVVPVNVWRVVPVVVWRVVPVRRIIPVNVWWVIPVWRIVTTTISKVREITIVSPYVPMLADWTLVFEGKAVVALIESLAV